MNKENIEKQEQFVYVCSDDDKRISRIPTC